MGTFSTNKLLNGNPSLIPTIATAIEQAFTAEGFSAQNMPLLSGGADISLSRGDIFKAILGMKTALKVKLTPQGNGILFEAGIGIFGQQVIPTIISMLLFWPVLITQIWGLVQQSELDDKALEIAEKVIREHQGESKPGASQGKEFCTKCGRELPEDALFCPGCGAHV